MLRLPANQFGRRPGRGFRPFFLLPKLVAISLSIGSLAAIFVVWLGSGIRWLSPDDLRRLWLLNIIGRVVCYVTVPAVAASVLFGVALLLQHPRQFIRMRWLIVKLVIVVAFIPSGHLFLQSRMELLRNAYMQGAAPGTIEVQFSWGLAAVLAVCILVAILGRLKPRFWQNWARDYGASVHPPRS